MDAPRSAVSLSDALDGVEQFQVVEPRDLRPSFLPAASNRPGELPESDPPGPHGFLFHQFAVGDRAQRNRGRLLRRLGGFRARQSALSAAQILPLIVFRRHDSARAGLPHSGLWALILPYTAQSLPVAILLFAAFFASLPAELEEAAKLDGVRTARFYFTILLPVARPAVVTVGVITCLNTWNEFLMAMLFIVDPGMKTLPVGMIAFEQAHNTDYPALLAGLSLISVPTLLVYAIFNKQVIRGVMAGAVK
ncbi:MAG: hypothetical protein DME18_14885 [Verrucomicrobia bacterium]|nr:MAG: hypothetical protein DME18_14885 [Verrucomicrobiota bacterium]